MARKTEQRGLRSRKLKPPFDKRLAVIYWVLNTGLDAESKLYLVALALHLNHRRKDYDVWSSEQTSADLCSLSRRTITYRKQQLLREQVLRRQRPHPDQRTHLYGSATTTLGIDLRVLKQKNEAPVRHRASNVKEVTRC